MYLDINETKQGYILQDKDKTIKYVLNTSKRQQQEKSKTAPYYLKQVEPTNLYISGMFKDKKKPLFNGKFNTSNLNFKVRVIFYTTGTAKVEFLPIGT
jgi:hypothetical protein